MTQQEAGEDIVAGKGGAGMTGNSTVVAQWVGGSCLTHVPELEGSGSGSQRTSQAQEGPT